MPQLRSGARRGLQPAAARLDPCQNTQSPLFVRSTRRTAGRRNKDKEVVVKGAVNGAGVLTETSDKAVDSNRVEELKEEVGEKKMNENGSGARCSGDKGVGPEDEGTTAPLPERVVKCCFNYFFFQIL